jgi:hypothetical protein
MKKSQYINISNKTQEILWTYFHLIIMMDYSSYAWWRRQKRIACREQGHCRTNRDESRPCFCVLCRTCTVKSCTVCQCDTCGRLKSDISPGSSSLCVGCHQLDQTICTMTCRCTICRQINQTLCSSTKYRCPHCWRIDKLICNNKTCYCDICGRIDQSLCICKDCLCNVCGLKNQDQCKFNVCYCRHCGKRDPDAPCADTTRCKCRHCRRLHDANDCKNGARARNGGDPSSAICPCSYRALNFQRLKQISQLDFETFTRVDVHGVHFGLQVFWAWYQQCLLNFIPPLVIRPKKHKIKTQTQTTTTNIQSSRPSRTAPVMIQLICKSKVQLIETVHVIGHDANSGDLYIQRYFNQTIHRLKYNVKNNMYKSKISHIISGQIKTLQEYLPKLSSLSIDVQRDHPNLISQQCLYIFNSSFPKELSHMIHIILDYATVEATMKSILLQVFPAGGDVLKKNVDIIKHHQILPSCLGTYSTLHTYSIPILFFIFSNKN